MTIKKLIRNLAIATLAVVVLKWRPMVGDVDCRILVLGMLSGVLALGTLLRVAR